MSYLRSLPVLIRAADVVLDSDKPTLRQDAKRLFSNETVTGEEWNSTFDMRYNSAKEAGRHALRDATAFATVALPSHYSVVYAVLDHIKRRMGADWQVDRVIDWGAATGSGLWFVRTCLWKQRGVITRSLNAGHRDMCSKGDPTRTEVMRKTWKISGYLRRA